MAGNNFNLLQLYSKVFNIRGVRFAISPDIQRVLQGGEFSALQTLDVIEPKTLSFLGTPIYEQITFKIPLSNGTFREYTLPDWPLIDVSASKNIIKTPIKGRNGSVKEYINIDDYQVTIRGILINYTSNAYPEEAVNELHDLFTVNKEMQVTTALLNLLDIHNLVITDIKIPEVEGFNNIQPFVISAISDEPVELLIKDIKNQSRIPSGL